MSTQIFINPNSNACKPEYTKIASYSFAMEPSVNIGVSKTILLYGGSNGIYGQATWSRDIYNYDNSSFAPAINISDKTVGIPIPINLVPNDIITISGTAYFNNASIYKNNGYTSTLKLGVFYFDCQSRISPIPGYTFLPVESFSISDNGDVCFQTQVTLTSNFDIHNTRLLVGFIVDVFCPEGCEVPPVESNLATVSYTLDVERPCPVDTTCFIIRNCCEPIITELVNSPGLVVGDFHVDDEGNCWEVVEQSKDVTNFTRNFIDTYTSCVECQAANPCPANLVISSCCVQGIELVSGSLPGLNVGDTFVDNNSLCWTVEGETGGPISEESITVDTIITGTCEDCTTINPCPDFWVVNSCCTRLSEIIATTIPLNVDDVFLDTNGICWSVIEQAFELPTNYNIIVDSVYTGSEDNCLNCKTDNGCPPEYFITIRGCCDNERIEVAQVPAQYMSFYEGMIFSDWWDVCWEVMSYSTTGTETYAIWDWTSVDIKIPNFESCVRCTENVSNGKCKTFYEVQNCNTGAIEIYKMQSDLTIGLYYINQLDKMCYQVLGYGYPAFNQSPTAFNAEKQWPDFYTCDECLTGTPSYKIVELQPCEGGLTFTTSLFGPWVNGIGSVQAVTVNSLGTTKCYTLISVTNPGPGPYPPANAYTNSSLTYVDCPTCQAVFP